MELWKKDERGLYEDLFDETRYNKRWLNRVYEETFERINTFKEQHPWQKGEKITEYKLRIADQLYNREKYHEAIESYNAALCFAKNGSKYIGMAYAARSNCFLRLNKATESEMDVKLVKECSNLIAHGGARSARMVFESVDGSMNNYDSDEDSVGTIDLVSDDEDEDISYFTKDIKFFAQSKDRFNVVAVDDIDVGDVVFSESCYVADNFVEIYKRCCICLNGSYTNLVLCKKVSSTKSISISFISFFRMLIHLSPFRPRLRSESSAPEPCFAMANVIKAIYINSNAVLSNVPLFRHR